MTAIQRQEHISQDSLFGCIRLTSLEEDCTNCTDHGMNRSSSKRKSMMLFRKRVPVSV